MEDRCKKDIPAVLAGKERNIDAISCCYMPRSLYLLEVVEWVSNGHFFVAVSAVRGSHGGDGNLWLSKTWAYFTDELGEAVGI